MLVQQFGERLRLADAQTAADGGTTLQERFAQLADKLARRRNVDRIPSDLKTQQRQIIGELRRTLAEACLEALEPDLVIMDEFQRFKDLLKANDDAGILAKRLFDFQHTEGRARVLLLSATPYKMYTLSQEEVEDDHYRDFVQTLRFLYDDDSKVEELDAHLKGYRDALLRTRRDNGGDLDDERAAIETRLRSVMIRTERLAATPERDGMLREIPSPSTLNQGDVQDYIALHEVGVAAGGGYDSLEYWKSAPYLLSFMDHYAFKQSFTRSLEDLAVVTALGRGPRLLLPWEDVAKYLEVDPANARLRSLVADTIERGAWRLLWIPPSLPYYRLEGSYGEPDLRDFTKRLIFSSWIVVPKVIACLLSYEAERRTVRLAEEDPENTPAARERRRTQLLQFTYSEGRLTGMPVLAMMYPSPTLAAMADPLELTADQRETGTSPGLGTVLAMAEERIANALERILEEARRDGVEDEAWYWAAPILLDSIGNDKLTAGWFAQPGLATLWSTAGEASDEDGAGRWADHVDQARSILSDRSTLGRPPADLARVLALLAIGGPGTCALRALGRITGPDALRESWWMRNASGRIAWAFRSLFNLPESTALIRSSGKDDPYWQQVLTHSAEGGLQSVLDEYAHVLVESLGVADKDLPERVQAVASMIASALTIRTPSLTVDDVRIQNGRITIARERLRARFALRFRDGSDTSDEEGAARPEQVRDAFNSPFWPFVLATTSVGQEGLDFHQFCHAVVHWNLPSNPVDLEQREGRVHRYKGHAVRKNLAWANQGTPFNGEDPWASMFDSAKSGRDEGTSDVIPYWVFAPASSPARIERHVPMVALSRDMARLEGLRRALVVYRMVFGQPRQDDLVEYLLQHLPADRVDQLMDAARIDLTPPHVSMEDVAPLVEPIRVEDLLALPAMADSEDRLASPDRRAAYVEFWDRFAILSEGVIPGLIKVKGPRQWSDLQISAGLPGARFRFGFPQRGGVRVDLALPMDGELYRSLERQRRRVDTAFGPGLTWKEPSGERPSIGITRKGSIRVHDDWDDYIGWMLESFVTLKATLRSHLERAPN